MSQASYIPFGRLEIRRKSDHRIVGKLLCVLAQIHMLLVEPDGTEIGIGIAESLEAGAQALLAASRLPDHGSNPLILARSGQLWRILARFPKALIAVRADPDSGMANDDQICAFTLDQSWVPQTFGSMHPCSDCWSVKVKNYNTPRTLFPDSISAIMALARYVFESQNPSAHERLRFQKAAGEIEPDLRRALEDACKAPWVRIAEKDRRMAAERDGKDASPAENP